jgi:colanic acid/amylovoran biosynthesis protein
MAFLLDPCSKKRINEIKIDEDTPKGKFVLGVSLSSLVEKRYDKSNNTPGENFIQSMAKIMDRIIEEHKAKILFIAHVTGPSISKDDRIIAKKVLEKMKNKRSATVLSGNYRPEELKGLISECDVFLGSRMHSNIAALSTNVPTVAIGYSHKTTGIMRSLGMSEFELKIDNLEIDKLYATIVKAYNDKLKLISRLNYEIKKIKDKSRENVEIIKRLVE